MTVQELVLLIESRSYRFASELELQDGIEAVLTFDGLEFEREFRLNEFSRLDFLVGGRIAIEIKTKGTAADLIRQSHRYLQHASIQGLVVVTHLMRLCRCLPLEINAKPVRAAYVGGPF